MLFTQRGRSVQGLRKAWDVRQPSRAFWTHQFMKGACPHTTVWLVQGIGSTYSGVPAAPAGTANQGPLLVNAQSPRVLSFVARTPTTNVALLALDLYALATFRQILTSGGSSESRTLPSCKAPQTLAKG